LSLTELCKALIVSKFGRAIIFTMDRGFGRFTLLGQMQEKGMRLVVRVKQDTQVDPGDTRLISLKWLSYAMALVDGSGADAEIFNE